VYQNKTVSIVFATYREKKSIKKIVDNFFRTGFVDQVIVVDNNAENGTLEEVAKTKATLITEKKQGYGYAYQKGIKHATGDFVVLCEPDGSYSASDLERFLVYAKDGFDAVLGSRTGQSTPLSGADITLLRKFANVIEAKTVEVLFNTNALTDVGCTYKLFTLKNLKKLSRQWVRKDSIFATELLLLTVTNNMKFIEIPITFKKRIGRSSLTDSNYKLVKWGITIQMYIFKFWLRRFFKG